MGNMNGYIETSCLACTYIYKYMTCKWRAMNVNEARSAWDIRYGQVIFLYNVPVFCFMHIISFHWNIGWKALNNKVNNKNDQHRVMAQKIAIDKIPEAHARFSPRLPSHCIAKLNQGRHSAVAGFICSGNSRNLPLWWLLAFGC